MPEPVRFAVSGALGSAAFWFLNEAAVAALPDSIPSPVTVAWFLSYLLSIWMQHALHSTLVYGWTSNYWAGLVATYTGYSGALLASVPINAGWVCTIPKHTVLSFCGAAARQHCLAVSTDEMYPCCACCTGLLAGWDCRPRKRGWEPSQLPGW
jgi:hypothetical protein